jgi:outer membrane protein assembly factor BamB
MRRHDAPQNVFSIAAIGIAQFIAVTAGCAPRPDPIAANQSSPPSTSDASNKLRGGSEGDWPQLGGTSLRNNTPVGTRIPTHWNKETGKNIKWKVDLGTTTRGTPVVANGKLFIGTNNGAGYLKRFPKDVDLGCLLCFDEQSGDFLWQHSSPKLKTGNPHDYGEQGICSAPLLEGDRAWFVSSRGCVICLDIEGFRDKENDGPYRHEDAVAADEADVVWQFDMMKELGVLQHNMCNCSVTSAGNLLLVTTSNGIDKTHDHVPAPDAPSFLALERHTGKVLWKDNSPGANILHGQWSSPAFAVLGGVPQAIFAGGDGWLYSFHLGGGKCGAAKLLWRFDCNPKLAVWRNSGYGDRNNVIATPVVYKNRVFVAVGQAPTHSEGPGRLWCIDPTRHLDGADVSLELVLDRNGNQVPHRRLQAVDREAGETVSSNPNSADIWCYTSCDTNGNGKTEYEETMHRTISNIAAKNDLLIAVDVSGVVHCLDAQTGVPHWTYDLMSEVWGSPLIVEDKVYIGDEEGHVSIFRLTANPGDGMKKAPVGRAEPIAQIQMDAPIYSTPIVANNVLYIATDKQLFAIQELPDE